MKIDGTYTITLSESEKRNLALALYEALEELNSPREDGYPYNWRSDPSFLSQFYKLLVK